jgi:hypothetical protein
MPDGEKIMAVNSRAVLRRAVLPLCVAALVVFTASCEGFFVSESSTQSVAVTPSAVLLKAAPDNVTSGDSTTLTATATTVSNSNNDVTATATWSSSDDTIATVSAGTVTVVGTAGGSTATITATSDGKSGTSTVLTFTGTAPSAITINIPGSVIPTALALGQQFQLTAVATLNGADTDITQYVTWTTNAASTVATVSSGGLVTVQNTATTGSNFTVTATAHMANNSTITETSTTFTVI